MQNNKIKNKKKWSVKFFFTFCNYHTSVISKSEKLTHPTVHFDSDLGPTFHFDSDLGPTFTLIWI